MIRTILKLSTYILCAVLCVAHAHAQDCAAGYWPNEKTGECADCGVDYYCPGNGVRNPCPDATENAPTTFPNAYGNATIWIIYYSSNNAASIERCHVIYWIKSERGIQYQYMYYNPTTAKYDKTSQWGWAAANPGYYLSNPMTCGPYAYYRELHECPTGYYCPGQSDRTVCNDSNKAEIFTDTFGLNKCPNGASTHVTGATSASVCKTLCGAGGTKLHVSNYEFNLWPDSQCSSPAIHIGLSGGTCCVNLESGTGSGLNIQTNGKTYHAVN